jgi:transcriptional regulator with XRE-family HTH domain
MGDGKRFATWLEGQLRRREWSQADFVRRTGFSSGVVSSWVTGSRKPKPESADRIASALSVDLDEVLDLIGARPNTPPDDDPDVLRIQALLRRVRLTPERVAGLEGVLRTWIAFDRERGGQ